MKSLKAFFQNPESFFLCLIAYLPFERMYDRFFRKFLYEYTDFSKGLIKSLYVCISDVSVFFFFLFWGFTGYFSWRRFFWEKEAKYSSFFLACLFICLALYFSRTDLSIWLRFFYFFVTLLLFNMVLQVFQKRETGPFLKKFFLLLMILGAIQTAIALGQYFSQGSLGLSFFSEPKISSPQFTKVGFLAKGVWLFDFWRCEKPFEVCRAFGTFSSPNLLGGYYLAFLFAIFGSWVYFPRLKGRFLLSFLLCIEIFGLFITYSRAALFSFFLMSFIWFFSFWKKGAFSQVRSLFYVFCFSLCLTFFLLFPQILARGGIVNYHDVVRGSDQQRVFTQGIAQKMFQEKPFLGWGYAQFSKEHRSFLPEEVREKTWMIHNIYLLLLVEGGGMGLFLFLLLCFFALRSGWQKREDPQVLALLLLFLAMLATGFCDFYWLFLSKMRLFFFFVAALLARVSYAEKIFSYRYFQRHQKQESL